MKPRIHVLVLGGTITMLPQSVGGIAPTLDGATLLAAVPGLSALANIAVSTPFLVPGASLSLPQLAEVAERIEAVLSEGTAGVVVVQGTDTIEETAFFLDLLHRGSQPVVVTGAMRGAGSPSADGDANLTAAIAVAASPAARDAGVLVVLNDEIHAAGHVRKLNTALPSAFASPGSGPLGGVAEGTVNLRLRPAARPSLHLSAPSDYPAVAIVKASLGDDGRLVAAAHDLGYRGLVVEAMGAGHVPADWVAPLADAVSAMPVVLATRVPGGPVFTRTYGFGGSETDLLNRGLVPAGFLSAEKARLLLTLLLGDQRSGPEIAIGFASFR